jgi:hypothetical protein
MWIIDLTKKIKQKSKKIAADQKLNNPEAFSRAEIFGFFLFFLFMIFFTWVIHRIQEGPVEFEKEIWLKSGDIVYASKNDNPRIRMAYGLEEDDSLLNKSRVEITELLGEPDRNDDVMAYWLGRERTRGGGIYPSTFVLRIYFDDSGRASSVRVYQK